VIFLGSTLNFASRLEGIAESDEIVASKGLKNMIQKKYNLREKMIPKAIEDRIKAYEDVAYEDVDVVYAVEGKRTTSKA
jgi:class 3 adenylate cyclase